MYKILQGLAIFQVDMTVLILQFSFFEFYLKQDFILIIDL